MFILKHTAAAASSTQNHNTKNMARINFETAIAHKT